MHGEIIYPNSVQLTRSRRVDSILSAYVNEKGWYFLHPLRKSDWMAPVLDLRK